MVGFEEHSPVLKTKPTSLEHLMQEGQEQEPKLALWWQQVGLCHPGWEEEDPLEEVGLAWWQQQLGLCQQWWWEGEH